MMMRTGILCALFLFACGPKGRPDTADDDQPAPDSDPGCTMACSDDLHSVVDCHGNVVTECEGATACDGGLFTCVDACTAAETNKRSVGCDYYATQMDMMFSGNCFAAFVANTWNSPVHITVKYQGVDQPAAAFTKLPVGSGPGLTYAAYDPVAGLQPNEVAILFLSGGTASSRSSKKRTPRSRWQSRRRASSSRGSSASSTRLARPLPTR